MENWSRRKLMTTATTIAVVTIVVVIMTKIIGGIVVAAFLAGVGVALTVAVLIVASLLSKPTNRRK